MTPLEANKDEKLKIKYLLELLVEECEAYIENICASRPKENKNQKRPV